MDILNKIYDSGIVPIAVINDADDMLPAARAIFEGGIDIAEITLRTDAGLAAIKKAAQNFPDMLIGAGTVITLDQCKQCIDAGAKFIITPGLNTQVLDWCSKNNITILPGCVTPTDIMTAMEYGIKTVKFFPAGVYGGLAALKSLASPFFEVSFIPTGGVSAKNMGDYLSAQYVPAVAGTWLCDKADVAAGNFEKITALCKEARRIVADVRNR